ncbi:caveolae-associated protein 2 [Nothobranchius furzeri]|uniref:Transcript variant X1 n=1 Tax=Nothobranchius furzeri TaxID=105023 RepID=A0A9D2Y863_NOTFU|nr:caveolae-associated protein 2 [Nothobranchius furzeri]KAF7215043.1 transcript variant X1 [Nothobranchius furzeri]
MEEDASGARASSSLSGSTHTLEQQQPESTEVLVPSRSPAPSSPGATTGTLSRFSLRNPTSPGPSSPGQVSAITVVALLDKLVLMLETVQDNQRRMEQRQGELEGAVKFLQGDVTRLNKSQALANVSVNKLLDKSRKVSVHVKEVKDRLDKQAVQVKKLESNHNHLLKRNNFKVLIFQEEQEIPAGVVVKDALKTPQPSQYDAESTRPNPSMTGSVEAVGAQEEVLPPVNTSTDEDDDVLGSELMEYEAAAISPVKFERRADQFKRSSLKKVDSLKKAFTRENIEKKMTKISSKIVPPEKREKIKKSFTPNHPKSSSAKTSSFKVSPMTFNVKKVRDGTDPSQEMSSPVGEAHVEIPTLGSLDGKIPAVELHSQESIVEELQETLNSSNSESLKEESVKVDGVKVENVKVDGVKVESVKVDGVKVDGVKVESVKVESPKAEGLKVDVSLNGKTPSVECEVNGDGVAGLAVPESDDVGEVEEKGEEKHTVAAEVAAGVQVPTETIAVEQVS